MDAAADGAVSSTHYRTSWQVFSFSSSTRVTSIWRMAALSRSSTAQWDVHARGWEEKIGQLGPTLFPFGYSPLARDVVDVVNSAIDFEFRISGFTNSAARRTNKVSKTLTSIDQRAPAHVLYRYHT
jgi:hypothetical protein